MKKDLIRRLIIVLVIVSITSFVLDYLMRRRSMFEGMENGDGDNSKTTQDKSCSKNTPIDPMKSYAATISFWKTSQLEAEPLKYEFDKETVKVGNTEMNVAISKSGDISVEEVLRKVKPVQTLTFTWEDPSECFAWIRDVAGSSGKTRLNVASDFEITNKMDGSHELSFTQNAGKCCDEFVDKDTGAEKEGTKKTFNSKTLTVDDSTCQQDDCLWVALTSIKLPSDDGKLRCGDSKICSL